MSDDLKLLEGWVGPFLDRLQPAARRGLSRSIGIALRRSQQRRIAAQQNPDGTPYAPRRAPAGTRDKAGRIKRKAMFVKLRQAKHLRMQASANDVSVGFAGRVARIARVHQEGGRETLRGRGRQATYPQRQLLGVRRSDCELIRDMLFKSLSSRPPP